MGTSSSICYSILLFSGLTTLVETGSIAVLYTLIIETFIHKDITIKKLYIITKKAAPVIGGILIISGSFQSFIILYDR